MAGRLHEIVRRAETGLTSGTVKLGKYVDWSLHDTLETIFAYLNSRHIAGSQDSLGRDKPFFNIVTAAVNIWYRATDLDRKDVVVLPDSNNSVVAAFLATVLLQDWMKRTRFGVFLNSWGRALAQYGSAVVKFIEKNGELYPSVVSWNRLVVDPIDFDALPRIEKFYKTPSQLRNMATKSHPDYAGYNLQAVEKLLDGRQSRETLSGEQVDNRAEFVELYEIHGELSQAVYHEAKGEKVLDGDDEVFFQQMHVISYLEAKDGDYTDFTVYAGKEKQDPYLLTHLIPEDGRTLAIGAVEHLFDAQWMQNHTMKAWKDQMDLTSKLVFQTADSNFVGKNVLTNIEVGQIFVHGEGKPITAFPNIGHDITSLQAFAQQWRVLTQEVTSTPDAARGNTLPSGTPYSLGAYLGGQALSLFEIMTENKGHDLEAMLRRYVIPHLKKKLDTTDEVVAILEDRDIQKLDAMYLPREAIRRYNKRAFKEILAGGVPSPYQAEVEQVPIRQELGQLGNQRSLSPGDVTWQEVLEDLEWKLDIGITNEQTDKQAVLTTLSTVLQTIATNPSVLQDPNARLVFNKILSRTATVSPIELSIPAAQPVPPVPAPEALPTTLPAVK